MRMKLLGLLAVIALTAAACGGGEETEVSMEALNDSGQTGTAMLTAAGDNQTRVVLELGNSPAGPQPAHIHEGTCEDLNPQPAHPLNNVANGKSETTVDVSLEELQDGDFAINIHQSPENIETYVSCGDIG